MVSLDHVFVGLVEEEGGIFLGNWDCCARPGWRFRTIRLIERGGGVLEITLLDVFMRFI